ncbi:MAG: acyl carrier protein [Gemmatimonadaceae bacterium]
MIPTNGRPTEEEFIARARRFLREIGGEKADSVDVDANLIESGILDSLAIIAYVAFVEEQRGSELEMGPEELALIMTIRSAYQLVRIAPSPNAA